MYDLTAAHRTLPFGTQVMVTNLENGRAVQVRINDRGPFVKDRVIDLSYAAARLIDMVGTGTAPVRLDVLLSLSPSLSAVRFDIQVGSFVDESNARDLERRLTARYAGVYVSVFRTATQTYYRVRLKAGDRPAAEELARRLGDEGFRVLICEAD